MKWLLCHSLSISSNWAHPCWGVLWQIFCRFLLLLEVFWLTSTSCPCKNFLDSFDQIFVVFRVILCHLMQSVICKSRRAFRPKNVSCIPVDFYPLLYIFSQEKLQVSAIIVRDIASMSTESAFWCSLKQKLISARLCNRSIPVKSL